ncbi:MAG: MoaD/ThiS family protein [Solirubrobacterales bacterium]
MTIEVRLFATFRNGREKKQSMDLKEGSKVADILDILNINVEELGILLINGRDGSVNSVLKESDVVALFPPVGGG